MMLDSKRREISAVFFPLQRKDAACSPAERGWFGRRGLSSSPGPGGKAGAAEGAMGQDSDYQAEINL